MTITVFFDDGGVINDNITRGQQWEKYVGEYYSLRFDGQPEVWGAANQKMISSFFDIFWRDGKEKFNDYQNFYNNFKRNMDYIPPALKAENYPIQYRDRIMVATQIPSASMSSGLLADHTPLPNSSGYELKENGYPSTVHVPQLPPIQQYYAIGGPLNNAPLYQGIQDTYSAMDARHQQFESAFRADMNRIGGS